MGVWFLGSSLLTLSVYLVGWGRSNADPTEQGFFFYNRRNIRLCSELLEAWQNQLHALGSELTVISEPLEHCQWATDKGDVQKESYSADVLVCIC